MVDVVSSIINSSSSTPSPAPESAVELQTGETIPDGATPPPTEVVPPKEDERLASRFAALSKKERMLLEREQKLKAEREEYEAYKKSKENAKADPLAYLEKSGLKLEDVLYSGLGSKPEQTVEDKIKELQDRLEQKEREEKELKTRTEQESIQAQVTGFRNSINKHIEDNAEKYELINLAGAHDEVYSLITAWLEKTTNEGKAQLMSIEDAASKVEEYYEQNMSEIFSKSKKLASKYRPIDAPKSNPASNTLTNKQVVTPSSSSPNETFLSFEQRREASLKRSAQLLEELQRKR